MSDLQVQGRLTKVFAPESGVSKTTGKEWNNLTFMVTTEGDHPDDIAFGLFGEKTSLIEKFNVGDLIEVKFNARSKEFNGKAFTNLNCWAVNLLETKAINTGLQSTGLPPSEQPAPDDSGNDLPF